MKALFFGTSRQPLFGVYEPPSGADARRGAVMCNPVGEEYYQAYRAYRGLARRIASGGAHVLRFDYIGTGNSGGEAVDFDADDWLENVGQAVDELKDMTGLRAVTLIGLRAGAFLAARAARLRRDVDRLVLWDPSVDDPDPSGVDRAHAEIVERISQWGIPAPGEECVRTLVLDRNASPRSDGTFPGSSRYTVLALSGPSPASRVGELGDGGLPVEALRSIAEWVTGSA